MLFYNSSAELVREIGNLPDITSFRVIGNDRIFLSGPAYSGKNEISQAVINFEGDTLMAVPNKFLFQPGVIMMFQNECVTYIRDEVLFYHEVMDGGMLFYPDLQVDDKYLVQVVDAFKFNLSLESDYFKAFNGSMDKKEDFRKLAERFTENDNPVLILCRVK